jgi:hypothetical protein
MLRERVVGLSLPGLDEEDHADAQAFVDGRRDPPVDRFRECETQRHLREGIADMEALLEAASGAFSVK